MNFTIRNSIKIALIVILFFSFSCKREDKPCLIEEKKMVELLTDMELAEAYATANIHGRNSYEERKALGQGVLDAHGYTREDVDTTLAWYGRNVDKYSELFEKVDKEILKRKKALMSDENVNETTDFIDLWPYDSHGIVSSLGNSDGWVLSVMNPDLTAGDRVMWSAYLPLPVDVRGMIGVEYSDGTAEAATSVFNGRPKIELELQTDTGKNITRLYGSLTLIDNNKYPVMADSIRIITEPYDSIKYRSIRGQKKFRLINP